MKLLIYRTIALPFVLFFSLGEVFSRKSFEACTKIVSTFLQLERSMMHDILKERKRKEGSV